jgi:hypothetical protein
MSFKAIRAADGTYTEVESTVTDLVGTLINPDEALFGNAALMQHALVTVVGMGFQNYRLGRGVNPFSG